MSTPDSFYVWGKTEPLGATNLTSRFLDLSNRLKPLESLDVSWQAALAGVNEAVLAQTESVLASLRAQLAAIVALDWLAATSTTSITLVEGEDRSISIATADRQLFAPGPYAVLSLNSDPNTYAVVKTAAYDRTLGQYDFTILTVAGGAGPYADWSVAAVAGSTLAQMTLLAQGQAATTAALADAVAAHTDRLVADGDAAATAADRAATHADRIAADSDATAAHTDRVAADADAAATSADRTATHADKLAADTSATNASTSETNAASSAAAAHTDRLAADADAVATAADRAATHTDRLAADASASSASTSAGNASSLVTLAQAAATQAATSAASIAGGPVTSVDGMTGIVTGVEKTANKGVASGYAGLDATGKVPTAQLPPVASFPVSGIVAKTAAYTIVPGDKGVMFDVSGAGFILTLPSVSGASPSSPLYFHIRRVDGSATAVGLACAGSDTYENGRTSINIYQETVTVVSFGGPWYFPPGGRQRGWVTVGTTTVASAVASVLFVAAFHDTEVNRIAFDYENVALSTTAYLTAMVSKGGVVQTSGYVGCALSTTGTTVVVMAPSNLAGKIPLAGVVNGTGTRQGDLEIFNPTSTTTGLQRLVFRGIDLYATPDISIGEATNTNAGAIDGVAFQASTGNVASGVFNQRVYRP